MTNPFVWFDNLNGKKSQSAQFLQSMFDWETKDLGPMQLVSDSKHGPFAGVSDEMESVCCGWIPYVEVDDLAIETSRARELGAEVVAADMVGPAGTATFLKDPGGAVLAIWKRAEQSQ
jgi:predicted enzyme related to lactoylglutathione lyase